MAVDSPTQSVSRLGPLPDAKLGPQEVHRWLQDFKWSFGERESKYATKYTYDPGTREQFKLVVGEYCRMEEEKDERQYGSLLDSLARLNAGGRMSPRWAEVMKVAYNFLEVGEYSALVTSALLTDTATSAEQRNGYLAQVMDEVRHTVQTGYLSHYIAKHHYDPAGAYDMRKVRYSSPFFAPCQRTIVDGFAAGDPVQCSLNLQLVAEAAFTNPLIVALSEWAAVNGDQVTPTVFLSIESDELRHMANAYHTIVSVVNNPDNLRYLQTDIENAFWIQHRFLTPFIGLVLEYGGEQKVEPWAKTWNRWIYEDWAGIWLGRFSKFGVKTPAPMPEAKQEAYFGHHFAFLAGYATWPLNNARLQIPSQREFEWFEREYPGWYNKVGYILDAWRRAKVDDPATGYIPISTFAENNVPLYFCRVCQVPTIVPDPAEGLAKMRILEYGGRKHALCSQWCERMFLLEPERYQRATFDEQFHGWELSEIVRAIGGVRSDGKTLIAQPHLRGERLWTLDDLKSCGVYMHSPLLLASNGNGNGH